MRDAGVPRSRPAARRGSRRCAPIFALLFALALSTPSTALDSTGTAPPERQQPALEQQVERALAAYQRGMDTADRAARLESFRRAERLLAAIEQAIIAAGRQPSAALLTALGNAALQAERIGPAVLAYRRALAIDPDHRQALENLSHARSLLPVAVRTTPRTSIADTFFFWHRSLSRAERRLAAACAFCLAGLLFAISLRTRRTGPRHFAVLPLLVWGALVTSLVVDRGEGSHAGVVIVDELVARSANSNNAPARFAEPLPGGTEVTVLEERDDWLLIRLASGRDGWVRGAGVARVVRDG